MRMSRGWRTWHSRRTRRAAATGPGRSGFTFDNARALLLALALVFELGEELDLIEQRLELFGGARLRLLVAEEGGDGGGEARVGAGEGDPIEQLALRELRARGGARRGGDGAEVVELRVNLAVPGEPLCARVEVSRERLARGADLRRVAAVLGEIGVELDV